MPIFLKSTRKNRLAILIYHRVLDKFDPLRPGEPTAEQFNWQMQLLNSHFTPLPLDQALHLMRKGKLPAKAVSVTFDDGYADNEKLALPILNRWKIPATIFVATGFLNGGRMWNDTVIESIRNMDRSEIELDFIGLAACSIDSPENKRYVAEKIIKHIKHMPHDRRQNAVDTIKSKARDLPDDLMMTDLQLRNLRDHGIDIGAHTISHPILKKIAPHEAKQEILTSRSHLEELLGSKVKYFAYPNGRFGVDYIQEHVDIVRSCGFDAALSTHWGVASKSSDLMQLPRFTPWDKTPEKFFIRLLLNYNRLD